MRQVWVIAALLALSNIPATTQETAEPQTTAIPDAKAANHPVQLMFPEAEFPIEAEREQKEGVCLVSMIVDTSGAPQNLSIVRCSDPMFAENSLAAAARSKFKPATTSDGKPVPVKISVEINFRLAAFNGSIRNYGLPAQIRYSFITPPGITSFNPDANGVYPLSKTIDPPRMVKFLDDGFGRVALPLDVGVSCDVILTINPKGVPSSPQVTRCDNSILEKPAIASLLRSRYKPGKMNGKAVPVRVSVHLVYNGTVPSEK